MDANRSTLVSEVDLIDPATGALRKGLPSELTDWAKDSDTFGYKLGQKMPNNVPEDAMWRVTRAPGENGEILNANPYSDFWVEGGDSAKKMNIFNSVRMAAFRSIRQEQIVWHQRRNFITDFAKGSEDGGIDLPPALSDRIFRALMYEAKDRFIQPRGMEPREMYTTAKRVLDDARRENSSYDNLATKLTERQVVLTLLRATQGDIGLVGVTQKVTGGVKAFAPGSGANYWGRISERLYPLMRFTLNPVFQTMEAVEPYVLGTMRGIFVPLRRDSEGYQNALATRNAISQLIRVSGDPDGIAAETAEALATQAYQGSEATAKFGRGKISRWMPHIGERKDVAAAMETERVMGDHMYAAFKQILGDGFEAFWADRELEYGTVNRGRIAKRWMAANFALQDVNGFDVATIDDILKTRNVGRRFRINKGGERGAYSFGDVERVLDYARTYDGSWSQGLRKERGLESGEALLEDLKNMSREEWHEEIKRSGLNSDGLERLSNHAADDIWHAANGPELDEFWNGRKLPNGKRDMTTGYRNAFLQDVTGTSAPWTRLARDQEILHARAIVQAMATGKGMTEEEFIKLHYEDLPKFLPSLADVVPIGGAATLEEIREAWASTVLRRGPKRVHPGDTFGITLTAEGSGLAADAEVGALHPLYHYLEETDADGLHYYQKMYAHNLEDFQDVVDSPDPESFYGVPHTAFTDRNSLLGAFRYGDAIVRIRRDAVETYGEVRPGIHTLNQDTVRPAKWELLTDDGWKQLGSTRMAPPAGGRRLESSKDLIVGPRHENPELQVGRELYSPVTDLTMLESGIAKVDVDRVLMSDAEREARAEYTAQGYEVINQWWRGHQLSYYLSDAAIERTSGYLDRAIAKGQLRDAKTLYRGIDITEAEDAGQQLDVDYVNLRPGERFDDKGYFSSSESINTAHTFAGTHTGWGSEDHVGVIITVKAPAGTHMALVESGESEHLFGRNAQFEVVTRRVEKRGDGTVVHITVIPVGQEVRPGVNKLALGEAPGALRNEGRLLQDVTLNPEQARAQIPEAEYYGLNGRYYSADDIHDVSSDIELAIQRAEEAKPPIDPVTVGPFRYGRRTVQDGLDEIRRTLTFDQIRAAGKALADFRARTRRTAESEVWATSVNPDERYAVVNNADTRLLAAAASGTVHYGGFRFGQRRMLDVMERLFSRGPAAVLDEGTPAIDRDIAAHLVRGEVYGMEQPVYGNRANDTLDAFLGNHSRRQTGRIDEIQPIVSDDNAAEFAGYLTQSAYDDHVAQDLIYNGQPRVPFVPRGRTFQTWEPAREWADETGFTIPHSDLTPEQKSAVYRYTGLGSDTINRSGEVVPELDALMRPIPESVQVTRAVNNADSIPGVNLDEVKVGQDLTAPYYLSTSMAQASGWTGKYRFDITVEQGTPSFFADPHSSVQGEAELMLGHDQTMRVTDITTDPDGTKVIHTTTRPEIPPTVQTAPVVAPYKPLEFYPGTPDEITHIPGNEVPVGAPPGPKERGTFSEPEPRGVTRSGVVIQEADGRVWVLEPTNHFGGYEHTFPKGGPDAGEDFRDAAMREAEEETGFTVRLTGYLGDFDNVQGTSRSRYYTAVRTGGGPATGDAAETAAVKLVTPDDARKMLIHDGVPDTRDQAVLEASEGLTPSRAVPETLPPEPEPIPTKDLPRTGEHLGGSTGARQVEDPATGKRYVDKRGNHPDHVREESTADRVYEALGVPVAPHTLIETESGPLKRASMIEGGETLDHFIHSGDHSAEEVRAVEDQLRSHYALDSLISNWDVLGMEGDNVIVKDGVAYRIDNGASFRYRAQGAAKGSRFGTTVDEIDNLRNPDLAAWGDRQVSIFGGVTDGMLRRQILDLGPQMDTILSLVPPELREQMKARYQDMLDRTAHMTPDAPAAGAEALPPPRVAPAAPLQPTKIGEYEHEYMVGFYNDLKDLANEQGLGGRSDWTAADIAQVAGRSREELGRRGGRTVSAQEVTRAEAQVHAAVAPGVGSPLHKFTPIFDILQQRRYRAEKQHLMNAASTNLHQALRDQLGLIVDSSDELGVGLFDDGPAPLFSTHVMSTPERLQDALDVIAYTTGQPVVRSFRVQPGTIDDYSRVTARASLVIKPNNMTAKMAERLAEAIGSEWPEAANMVATRTADGGWVLSVMDDTGELLPRVKATGAVDEDALHDLFTDVLSGVPMDAETEARVSVDYGDLVEAKPPRNGDGSVNWDGYAQDIESRSAERGVPISSSVLADIRTSYNSTIDHELQRAAPDQYDRIERGEPISGHNLEDRRGGDTLGATSPRGQHAAVVYGFTNSDALTGLHELVHVFSLGSSDTSLRDVVSKAFDDYQMANSAAKEARIADLQAKIAATSHTGLQTRYQNQITALRRDLQNPHPSEWGQPQEEYLVHLIYQWIDRGVPANPELDNAFEHFRNWLTVAKKELEQAGAWPRSNCPCDGGYAQPDVQPPGRGDRALLGRAADHADGRAAGAAVGVGRSPRHPVLQARPLDGRAEHQPPLHRALSGLLHVGQNPARDGPLPRSSAVRHGDAVPRVERAARGQRQRPGPERDWTPSFKKFLDRQRGRLHALLDVLPGHCRRTLPANAALPVRRIAEQGLENQRGVRAGREPGRRQGHRLRQGRAGRDPVRAGSAGSIRTAARPSGMGGNLVRSSIGAVQDAPTGQAPVQDIVPLR